MQITICDVCGTDKNKGKVSEKGGLNACACQKTKTDNRGF